MVRSLSERGHKVDLLVYHEGHDVSYPGITLHRIPSLPFISNVRPGLSFKKIVCDFFLFWKAVGLVRRNRPDIVHAVEESAFMAYVIRLLFGIPYVYDMDSSLPDQVVEKFPAFRPMQGLMRMLIKPIVTHALLVAPVCEAIAQTITPCEPAKIVILRDVSLLDEDKRKTPKAK